MITAILIDDEEIALKSLENKIKRNIPYVEILFTTQDPEEGVLKINELKSDLVFLDIDMPVISGFDVLSKIDAPDMEVIFVTAHFNYAITAIKHNAVDYILKPIDVLELKAAVEKVKSNLAKRVNLDKQISLLQNKTSKNSSIIIPTQKGLSFFKPNQIIRLEGSEGYTKIHTINNKPILSSANIGKFISIFENFNFFHAHKSHIVNMDFIKNYLNEGTLELTNGDFVPLSKPKKKLFLEQLDTKI
ncbi:MAG: LytR/AlgR family response regulator transcription factor [Flavobacteriales bacterium]